LERHRNTTDRETVADAATENRSSSSTSNCGCFTFSGYNNVTYDKHAQQKDLAKKGKT